MSERFDDAQHNWLCVVLVLGSDVATLLLSELELEPVYSVRLRELAREFISNAEEGLWPDDLTKGCSGRVSAGGFGDSGRRRK
jgi:hypothetical protein